MPLVDDGVRCTNAGMPRCKASNLTVIQSYPLCAARVCDHSGAYFGIDLVTYQFSFAGGPAPGEDIGSSLFPSLILLPLFSVLHFVLFWLDRECVMFFS
jgi:hypothetical protein